MAEESEHSDDLKQGRVRKSLLEQLADYGDQPTESRESMIRKDLCAMKTDSCPLCKGEGLRQGRRGIYASAELCECILACKVCLGKNLDVSSGVARSCKSPRPLKRSGLYNKACIPSRYTGARLENFANKTGNCQERARDVSRWVDNLARDKKIHNYPGFILSGPVGCGKTYLLAAAAKRLAANGISVRFVDFFQLISEIKTSLMTKEAMASDFLKVFMDVDVLAIDELGKGRRTDFEQTVLDQLVMGRYNQEKITIASTNCTLGKTYQKDADQLGEGRFGKTDIPLIQAVGERIYSRLEETTEFLAMDGLDFRSVQSR